MSDRVKLQNILNKSSQYVFISPHFDDVLLSCASLIKTLPVSRISVINVFTTAHNGPYTFSARKFLRLSSQSDAMLLYTKRAQEDMDAFSSLGITTITNLGFEDGLFRKKHPLPFFGKVLPELSHLYPVYRFHILGDISPSDNVDTKIKKELRRMFPKTRKLLVFIPLGVGNHVDHQLTRRVCEELFDTIIYYSDFPYNRSKNSFHAIPPGFETYEIPVNRKEKTMILRQYKTQFQGLFPDGTVPKHTEVFYARNI